MPEKLFASFILDRNMGLEIAVSAESVTEATTITEKIQQLPASIHFLEGLMYLRDSVIPVLNMKKRMAISDSGEYDADAKIAVVSIGGQLFGLLFEDIQEVLRVNESAIIPIPPALQSDDHIISAIITIKDQHRTLEVLDLDRLFPEGIIPDFQENDKPDETANARTYSRYVIFSSGDLDYGIPVENSRELTFITDIDDMFKSGFLEGALQLRGRTIPVLNACALLSDGKVSRIPGENGRILIMTSSAISFGMIIDEIKEIATIADDEVMTLPPGDNNCVTGIYEPTSGRNIILLDVDHLIYSQADLLESMSRLRKDEEEIADSRTRTSRHLITENCYLIFSIGKHFAIELKDVQEIIKYEDLMSLPGANGYDSEILNLRGTILPVINLRQFYNLDTPQPEDLSARLIICGNGRNAVALLVDTIETIYKQEQFHTTPSLNPQLQAKKDTLDRLIEYTGENRLKEHVLVLNIKNMLTNHLQRSESINPSGNISQCPPREETENMNTISPVPAGNF